MISRTCIFCFSCYFSGFTSRLFLTCLTPDTLVTCQFMEGAHLCPTSMPFYLGFLEYLNDWHHLISHFSPLWSALQTRFISPPYPSIPVSVQYCTLCIPVLAHFIICEVFYFTCLFFPRVKFRESRDLIIWFISVSLASDT